MSNVWKRIDTYAIGRDGWTIAKVFVDGCTLYELWSPDNQRIGHFECADDAKAMAAKLEIAGQA